MPRRAHIALVYLLAYLAALGTAYAVMRLQAGAAFAPGQTGPSGLRLLAAPVAGVAAFALVYGIGRGRALRGGFWVLAAVVLLAMWGAAYLLIGAGMGPVAALGLVVLVTLPAGLALALRVEGD
jgi:hypothetical protein